MKSIDVHRAWAPADGTWSAWVKPALFAALDRTAIVDGERLPAFPDWFVAEVLSPLDEHVASRANPYRAGLPEDAALVIDLPGAAGAEVGVSLAAHRFRPVPLYNALPSPVAIVDVAPIMAVLARHAEAVSQVARTAPPAFLLDADRMGDGRPLRPGLFDNRSICRKSDSHRARGSWSTGSAVSCSFATRSKRTSKPSRSSGRLPG